MVAPDGAYAGDNSVTASSDGCVLREPWRGVGGGEGESVTWLDPGTGRWRQVRVSGGFTIDVEGAPEQDGVMRLEGRIHYRDGRAAPFRGRWEARDRGVVLQTFHERDADGAWREWFVGRYVPAP